MIILRNKGYSGSDNIKSELDKKSVPRELEGLSTQTIAGPYKSPLTDGGISTPKNMEPEGNIDISEKTLSETPMGISYVKSVKPKKRSRIAKVMRNTANPVLNKVDKTLDKLPGMSVENKIKQKRKINAIKFYIDSATGGLDKVAEKVYSEERMPVSIADMRKAETEGVVQKRPDGKWGIIAKKKRLWWSAGYDSRESAEAALRAYHAGRH